MVKKRGRGINGTKTYVLNICILKDNVGGLSTELESNLLEVALCGSLKDVTSDKGGTSESNLVDVHMASNSSSSSTSEAGNNVDDARGEASFLDQLGGIEGGQRSLLSGLEDNSVTSGDGRTDLPRPHQHGEVPRNDLTADTDGFVASVGECLRVDVNGLAVDLVSPASIVANAASSTGHVQLGDAEGLAVVKSLNGSEGLDFALHQIGQLVKHTATVRGSNLSPGTLECLASSGNGNVDILLSGFVDSNNGLLGGGVDGLEGLAFNTLHKLIVDEPRNEKQLERHEE